MELKNQMTKLANSKNSVAKILKVYAIINAIAGLILGLILAIDWDTALGLIVIVAVLVLSFAIYAFGEIIHLLHCINVNTSSQYSPVVANAAIQNNAVMQNAAVVVQNDPVQNAILMQEMQIKQEIETRQEIESCLPDM